MPGPAPCSIWLTPLHRTLLEGVARRPTQPHRLVQRVGIILALADDPHVGRIARQLRLGRLTVRTWRDRWLAAVPTLCAAEAAGEAVAALLTRITTLFADAPRPGAPATFTPEQVCGIIALACTSPAAAARPVTHWTPAELAAEAMRQGIVPTISARSAGRFLKRGRAQAASDALLPPPSPRRR